MFETVSIIQFLNVPDNSLLVEINQYPDSRVTQSLKLYIDWTAVKRELMSMSRAADRLSMYVYTGNQGTPLSATCWQRVNLRLIQLICCLFHADMFYV